MCFRRKIEKVSKHTAYQNFFEKERVIFYVIQYNHLRILHACIKKGLESFDSALADEIIHDFESHFADARSQGLSDEEICAELGDVNDVLTFFHQEYATTEQPVARTEAKTSNAKGHLSTSTSTGSASQSSSALPDINAQLSQEPQYSYPSDPAASITRMEIVLRNASASFVPGTSACVSFDCTRELDPDRFEVGVDGNTFYLREKKISAAVFWKHFFYTRQKTEKFIFQVPSTVQQITLRSVNGGAELNHLSLEKLEIFPQTESWSAILLPYPTAICRQPMGNWFLQTYRPTTSRLPPQTENCRHLPAAPALF